MRAAIGAAAAAGIPRSSGSGRHLLSATSTVIRQVRVCCCRDLLRVGNSDRTVTEGAGIGFRETGRGLPGVVSIA